MTGAPLRSGEVVVLPPRPDQRFSELDLRIMRQCCRGTCRIAIWDTEPGSFAMVSPMHDGPAPYALAREGGRVKLWNSVSLADLGFYDTLPEALAAIPAIRVTLPLETANVVPFPTRPTLSRRD